MMVSASVAERLGETLTGVIEALKGAGRVEASEQMGLEVQALIVRHLEELALSKHDTANRLGASPTGFIAQAADAASDASAVQPDGEGVSIRIRHPVVSRAFRSISIRPKNAKRLAIPVHRLAYGRRPAELFEPLGLKFAGNTIVQPQGDGEEDLVLYVLVRSVTQPQDRSLMPSDEEMADAAADGLRFYIRNALS
jgi:hypothetical protein